MARGNIQITDAAIFLLKIKCLTYVFYFEGFTCVCHVLLYISSCVYLADVFVFFSLSCEFVFVCV